MKNIKIFIYINIFIVILFLTVIYVNRNIILVIKRNRNNILKIVKNVVVPTIVNEQSYFFVKTKYKGISFYQFIRSNDYISNYIKNEGKWQECQDIFDIYNSGSRKGIFIDFGANIGSCSFLFAQAGVDVYAFEPLPNNLFPFTLTTFRNNIFSKYITIFPYALG